MIDKIRCCCFFGHRKIKETEELKEAVCNAVEDLITSKNVDTFYFGSKSDFDDFCHSIVTELKEKYPHIQRIYVRAEFPYIDDSYRNYLLERYEDTYYPERMVDAGKAAYVERNYEMINNSKYCIVYYDDSYAPPRRRNSRRDLTDYQPKSGTKVAYDYAIKKSDVINVFQKKENMENV